MSVVGALGAYGKFRVYTGAVVSVVVGLCMCLSGGYMIKNPDKHSVKTTGTIKEVIQKDSGTWEITAVYSVNNKQYTISTLLYGPSFTKDQSVVIWYDPDNPQDGSTAGGPKWMGWAFIGAASLIILFGVGFAYFFSKLGNKGKAVVGGLQAASDTWALFGSRD